MNTFTSESVTPGHPDKVCDQISDALLDACLAYDPLSRVAVETMATARGIVVAGEVTSESSVDVPDTVRRVLSDIGYTEAAGLDPDAFPVIDRLTAQSPEIRAAVHRSNIGAGDQGMMFGYATQETRELMPLPLMLARRLTERLTTARTSGELPWLRPDGKAQVTVRYRGGEPVGVDAVVVSTQHSPDILLNDVREALREFVVRPVLEQYGFSSSMDSAAMHLNPAGAWHLGGPAADAGLTGRKIIVDTYGGMARHGGGAFSGKDGSKVDRSAAYAARQAAKWIVTSSLAPSAEVQLSYAIGVPEPVGISVFTPGGVEAEAIERELRERYDFTPSGIIDRLGLTEPKFATTARFGHFGHDEFSWERV